MDTHEFSEYRQGFTALSGVLLPCLFILKKYYINNIRYGKIKKMYIQSLENHYMLLYMGENRKS
jgi:hypothetical protein